MAARLALEVEDVDRLVLVSSGSLAPEGSAQSRELRRKHTADLNSYQPSLAAMRTMTERTLCNQDLVDELVEERYVMSIGPLYDAMLGRAATPAPVSIEARLGEIKNRTLLIWGDRDAGVTMERGLLLFGALADAELHIFHDAAHWPQWDQAERFNQLVAAFLR
jgi:pimeloyl-ACP methyl ester carboxylesterase